MCVVKDNNPRPVIDKLLRLLSKEWDIPRCFCTLTELLQNLEGGCNG